MNQIEITPELLAELKEKAKKATPGPWGWYGVTGSNGSAMRTVLDQDNEKVCELLNFKNTIANTEYIVAANPSAILALIEDYENKKEALHGMYLLVDKLKECMNLDVSVGVEGAIQGALNQINDLNAKLSAEGNAREEAQEIIIELKQEKTTLEKEADWLADVMAKRDCPHGCPQEDAPLLEECTECWRKAAREAVETE